MARTKDRTYLRNRKRVLAEQDTCWLCGHWIDPDLKHPHPYSATADHVIPIGQGGHNHGELRAAHLHCNQSRGKGEPPPPRHSRQW